MTTQTSAAESPTAALDNSSPGSAARSGTGNHIWLNTDLLQRRRRSVGVSLRDVAAATGISPHLLNQLERGADPALLNLTQLTRLADTLRCPVTALLDIDNTTDTDTTGSDIDDAGLLAAALHRGDLLSRDVLADAHGWTLDRVEIALLELERRAPAYGWRLVRRGLDVRLLSQLNRVPVEQIATLQRSHDIRQRPETEVVTALLRAIESGTVDHDATSANALTQLRAAGLIDEHGQPAECVLLSLGLQ